jgi:hypothetical protein
MREKLFLSVSYTLYMHSLQVRINCFQGDPARRDLNLFTCNTTTARCFFVRFSCALHSGCPFLYQLLSPAAVIEWQRTRSAHQARAQLVCENEGNVVSISRCLTYCATACDCFITCCIKKREMKPVGMNYK